MNIDVEYIAKLVGYIVTIVAAGAGVYKVVKNYFGKYVIGKIKSVENETGSLRRDVNALVSWTEKQQEDIHSASERDAILMEAQLASLEAIHQGKNNGNVDGAIASLRQYMTKHSSRTSSYIKK